MATEVGSLEWTADVDLSGFRREVSQANSEFEELSDNVQNSDLDASSEIEDTGDAAGEAGDAFGEMGEALDDIPFAGAIAKAGRMTGALGALGPAAAAAAAAFAGFQLSQTVAGFGDVQQQLQNAATQAGTTEEQIRSLQQLMNRLGENVDAETVGNLMREISVRMGEAQQGTGEAAEGFEQLGISMEQLETMSTSETLQEIISRTEDMSAAQRNATLEQVAGGEAAERLTRLYRAQDEELQNLTDSQQTAVDITDDQEQALTSVSQRWTEMGQQLSNVQTELAAAFAPFVSDTLIPILEALVNAIELVSDAITGMISAFQNAKDQISQIELFGLPIGEILTMDSPFEIAVDVAAGRTPDAPGFGSEEEEQAPQFQQPQMGPDETVDFGGSVSSEDTEELNRQQKILQQLQNDIGAVRREYREGMVPEQQMLEQIATFRRNAAQELISLQQESPEIVTDEDINSMVQKMQQAMGRVRREIIENLQIPDSQKIKAADLIDLETGDIADKIPDNIQGPQGGDGGGGGDDQTQSGISRDMAENLAPMLGMESTSKNIDKIIKKLNKVPGAAQQVAGAMRSLNRTGTQAMAEIGAAVGQALGKMMAGMGGVEDLGKALLQQIASLMQQIASALLSIGSALLLAPGMQAQGAAYLAAGTLLMAGASALKASIKQSESGGGGASSEAGPSDTIGLQSGGLVQADGMAMLHENEVVRDAKVDDRLFQSAMEDSGRGDENLSTRVRGNELQFILERQNRRNQLAGIAQNSR